MEFQYHQNFDHIGLILFFRWILGLALTQNLPAMKLEDLSQGRYLWRQDNYAPWLLKQDLHQKCIWCLKMFSRSSFEFNKMLFLDFRCQHAKCKYKTQAIDSVNFCSPVVSLLVLVLNLVNVSVMNEVLFVEPKCNFT